jgi:trigger factor
MILADLQFHFLDGTTLPIKPDSVIDTRAGIVDGIPCPGAIGQFVGVSPGDVVKLSVEIPKDHPLEEHREKTAVVHCTVKAIHRQVLPELESPEFLEQLGVESVEQLRERMRERMQNHLASQRERLLESLCIDQLLEQHSFDLPPAYLERLLEAERRRIREDLEQRGAPVEDVERQLLEVDGRLREQIERRTREQVLLDRIAEVEKTTVEPDQVNHHFQLLARTLGMPAQDIYDHFVETGKLSSVIEGLRRDNVRRLLREAALTTDEVGQQEDLSPSPNPSAEETP